MRTTTVHHFAIESAHLDNDAKSRPTLAKPCWQGWQGELFPLEPWGAPAEFALVDWPHPKIARAMVGPLPLGFAGVEQAKSFAIQCLAATAYRGFAACVEVDASDLADPDRLWAAVARDIEAARKDLLRGDLKLTPEAASLAAWSDLAFWIRRRDGNGDTVHPAARVRALAQAHPVRQTLQRPSEGDAIELERTAQVALSVQIASGVQQVVMALAPELAAALLNRRHLSVAVALRLLALARLVNERAVGYTIQALRTESLGLLHLASSGNPATEGLRVREALFAGHSMPDALREMGVSKATHRRSLRPPRGANPQSMLSELQVPGTSWLALVRLLSTPGSAVWPRSAWDGEAMLATLNKLLPLKLGPALESRVVAWCMKSGHAEADARVSLLLAHAAALIRATRGLADTAMSTDEAIVQTLGLVKRHKLDRGGLANLDTLLDPRNVAQLVQEVAHFAKQPFVPLAKRLLASVFARHPGAPPRVVEPQMRLLALDSLEFVVENGHALGTCLADPRVALGYIAQGAALYVLFDPAVGAFHLTIALGLDCSDAAPVVKVLEVVDLEDAPASEASVRKAKSLASAWQPDQLTAWYNYNVAAEELRQRVGLIEGETDGRN